LNINKKLSSLNLTFFRKKKKKYTKKTEKLGLIYDDTTSEIQVYQVYLRLSVFLNFKKKYIVKTKKIKPGSLLSGQIAKDLKVGDKKMIKDSKKR
jgi:hypothetical protein